MKKSEETTKVETLQKGISEKQTKNVSELDASVLKDLRRLQPYFNDGMDKLGIVLEELVNMLDLNGTGIDVYLLQYVVDARQSLRTVLQLLENVSDLKEKASDN